MASHKVNVSASFGSYCRYVVLGFFFFFSVVFRLENDLVGPVRAPDFSFLERILSLKPLCRTWTMGIEAFGACSNVCRAVDRDSLLI